MDSSVSTLSSFLTNFHFLRPEWFYALIPAIIATFWLFRCRNQAGNWDQVISPELLPFLLDRIPEKQRRSLPILALIGWTLAAVAMAGPTWERTPMPVHKQENALVVIFDLSPSTLAQDLKPNRLTRARLKLIDLLNQRKEGTTGLVAYAGDAYVVSPLTDDADTVSALVPALEPNIMPSHGSHVEAAIEDAVELILNAGLLEGNLLLITDGVAPSASDRVTTILRDSGDFRLSILGVGTKEGAPIPLGNGGFAKDHNGNIVVPQLDVNQLKGLANLNGGRYTSLTTDDSDILFLAEQFNATTDSPNKQLERTFDSWSDQGYWATLPLLLILLLAFRRGLLACLLIAPLLATPEISYALSWDDLWATKDQQAAKALEQGDAEAAQQQFRDPNWKAAAAYRNGDYDTAKKLYGSEENTDYYNLGNSLAKSGQLEEAMESYAKALEQDPNNEDAKFNKERVEEKLQQQQEQQKSQQDSSNNKPQESSQGDPQKGDPQDQSQKENDDKDQPQDKLQENPPEQSPDNQPDPDQKEQEKENEQQANEGQEQQPMTSTDEQKETEEAQNTDQGLASQGHTEPKPMSDEEKQAMEQWLRKIPDDPGGLLREKFRYESKKRAYERRRGIIPPSETSEERW